MSQPLVPTLFLTFSLPVEHGPVQSLSDGGPARSRELALKMRSSCHIVAPDQPNSSLLRPPAPDFYGIANRRKTTAESLRNFISTTHASIDNPEKMYNPELTDDRTVSVIAYILTLRKH